MPIACPQTTERDLLLPLLRALIVAAILLFPAFPKADEPPGEPTQAAMAFVEKFSDGHLTAMLTRIGARHPTLVAMSQLHGQMLAAAYDTEVKRSVEKYGAQWRTNMARAWSGLLTDEELTSLFSDGAASPHSEKYKSASKDAGQRMQSLSADLFKKVLNETVKNTIAVLAEPAEGAETPKTDND